MAVEGNHDNSLPWGDMNDEWPGKKKQYSIQVVGFLLRGDRAQEVDSQKIRYR